MTQDPNDFRGRYLVWNPSHGIPTFEHRGFDTAKAEAERLARCHPGQVFLVMAPMGYCKVEKAGEFVAFPDALEVPF